jgi:hypothetical protein
MPQTYYLSARSLFVTVTAWVFIALALMGGLSGLLQQATLASWLPALQTLPGAAPIGGLPWPARWLAAYLPWWIGTGVGVSLALLTSAVGLLMRREWARRLFIGLLALLIVLNLGGLWLQHTFVQILVDSTLRSGPLPPSAADVFGGFVTAARVMAVIVTLSACGLLGWVIRRLMSAPVRQEFA